MKKIILILIIITLLLSLTACGNKDGSFPKDDGKRYANVVDAHYEEENCTKSEVIYEIEIDGIVCSSITTIGGAEFSMVYKDSEGYVAATNGNFSVDTTLMLNEGRVSIKLANNRHVVYISSLQYEQKYIHKIADNLNSTFKYGEKFIGGVYWYGYMTVLDEIPKDYAIIIDGVSYKISDYMSLGTRTTIMFSVLFTGIGAFVLMLIIRKIKKKKRNKLPKTLFK